MACGSLTGKFGICRQIVPESMSAGFETSLPIHVTLRPTWFTAASSSLWSVGYEYERAFI